MNVVIGLGNPGIEYENTVHNAGFRVVDAVRQKVKANYQKGKNFEYFDYNGIRFVRPLTFMNLSGEVFRNLFLDNIENLVVICDNIDLAFGALRFKEGGSAGGHNGLKSIIAHNPKGADFFRLYVGGKTDNPYISTVDYVLQKLKGDKFDDFAITCVTAAEYLLEFLVGVGKNAQGKEEGQAKKQSQSPSQPQSTSQSQSHSLSQPQSQPQTHSLSPLELIKLKCTSYSKQKNLNN